MTAFSIGRHPDCDIVLHDNSVSRHHAELRLLDDGRYQLTDLESTYGTHIKANGEWKRIDTVVVGPDDPVMLGNHKTTPYLLHSQALSPQAKEPTGPAKREKTSGEISKVRKLTAIVAADLVGYSAMMNSDESATLTVLKQCREEVIDPKVMRHHGRVFKTIGDGLMMEFASVVRAVRCAADIQATLRTMTFGPNEVRLQFRMGINIGDVIIEGDDIFGDGVNIAARLEQIADPGGVCISGFVYEQVKNKLDLGYQDLGEREVKNIPEPVRVYKVVETVSGRYIPG